MKDINKTYVVSCPYCKKENKVVKNLYMLMGLSEKGVGKCPKCDMWIELHYDVPKDSIIAKTGQANDKINEHVSNSAKTS